MRHTLLLSHPFSFMWQWGKTSLSNISTSISTVCLRTGQYASKVFSTLYYVFDHYKIDTEVLYDCKKKAAASKIWIKIIIFGTIRRWIGGQSEMNCIYLGKYKLNIYKVTYVPLT